MGLFAISGINWAYFEIKSGRERENIISVENTVKTLLQAAASIHFDEILAQNLLSKI